MHLKHKELYIFSLIIVLQVVAILYWGKTKTNYFIDELYSMGYVSSYTGRGDTAQYITTSPDFRFDEWIENSLFKKYLLISDEEKIINESLPSAIQKLITGRNYFGLLNLAESIWGYGFVSSRPAVIYNNGDI